MTFGGTDGEPAEPRRSLFQLIGSLPSLIGDLVRAEIDAIKQEPKEKAIRAGVGVGLLLTGVFTLLLALVVLVIAAIAGLATVLPFWASALIIFGVLVLLAIVFVFAGLAALKSTKGAPEQIGKLGDDFRLLSREGRREARAREQAERATD